MRITKTIRILNVIAGIRICVSGCTNRGVSVGCSWVLLLVSGPSILNRGMCIQGVSVREGGGPEAKLISSWSIFDMPASLYTTM